MQTAKAHVQEVEGHATEDQKKNPNSQHLNKPSLISTHEDLQSWLIDTVYNLLVKNNKGRGGEWDLKEMGAY